MLSVHGKAWKKLNHISYVILLKVNEARQYCTNSLVFNLVLSSLDFLVAALLKFAYEVLVVPSGTKNLGSGSHHGNTFFLLQTTLSS